MADNQIIKRSDEIKSQRSVIILFNIVLTFEKQNEYNNNVRTGNSEIFCSPISKLRLFCLQTAKNSCVSYFNYVPGVINRDR